MVCFRDAHFVIGGEDEKKTEEDDRVISDPKYVAFIQPITLCKLKLQTTRKTSEAKSRGIWPAA